MFRLLTKVCVTLLSFSRFLATKCVSINNASCVTRPTLNDLNPLWFNYIHA